MITNLGDSIKLFLQDTYKVTYWLILSFFYYTPLLILALFLQWRYIENNLPDGRSGLIPVAYWCLAIPLTIAGSLLYVLVIYSIANATESRAVQFLLRILVLITPVAVLLLLFILFLVIFSILGVFNVV